MSEIIYDDKASAKAACEGYLKVTNELQQKLGVWEENEDSCTLTFVYARYRNESGKVVNYCHG